MGDLFSMDRTVRYSVTLARGTDFYISLAGLFSYFQDITIAHSEEVNDGLKILAEKKRGWAIINQIVDIKRRPRHGEKITISTWSDFCERCMATRSYQIKDCDGNILVDAYSKWALLDMEKRRLINVDDEVAKAYLCNIPPVFTKDDFHIEEDHEKIQVCEDTFIIQRRDTDTNGHANNTKYIEWIASIMPDEIYENYEMTGCKIHYKKEFRRGETVIAKGFLNKDKTKFTAVFSKPDREGCVAEISISPLS